MIGGDLGTLGTTRKDNVMPRLGFLPMLGGFRDPLREFVRYLGLKNVYCVMLVSSLFL